MAWPVGQSSLSLSLFFFFRNARQRVSLNQRLADLVQNAVARRNVRLLDRLSAVRTSRDRNRKSSQRGHIASSSKRAAVHLACDAHVLDHLNQRRVVHELQLGKPQFLGRLVHGVVVHGEDRERSLTRENLVKSRLLHRRPEDHEVGVACDGSVHIVTKTSTTFLTTLRVKRADQGGATTTKRTSGRGSRTGTADERAVHHSYSSCDSS
mmetsp:Transcript_4751/g.10631  ORF Transcript_4751/g.10631 Transcript_4751/m.10631 type:complete len:209 (-) Transcript_4751:76-702(-)